MERRAIYLYSYIDISKVVDRVWYDASVSKLSVFDGESIFAQFVSSCVDNRSITVVIDRYSLNGFYLNASVP